MPKTAGIYSVSKREILPFSCMTRVFIKTFGCALNQSDSEVMAGLLEQAEFRIVHSSRKADLIIINSCTVKKPTETKFFSYLRKLKRLGKPIVIAGCIPQTDPEKVRGFSLIGTSQITHIVEVVEEAINDNTVELLAEEPCQKLNLPKVRKNKTIEIIPICSGCLGSPCAYCKVKAARGSLVSYDKREILKQAQHAIAEGIKEIWLTAQDTGCWGKDRNETLPMLLREIVNLNGNFKIRVGMANPNHVIEFLDELIEAFKSEKVFKFVHIPVQSGSDKILKSMKRKYTAEEFEKIIMRFRQEIPEITIATDIICGFPGETEEDFNETLKLIRGIQPDVLNISRFWARPKTEAEKMKNKIHGSETNKRSRMLAEIFTNIAQMRNERWLDWHGYVIVDELGKDSTFIGRNLAYKPVILTGSHKLGDVVKVRIRKATPYDLRADILS